MMCCFLAAMDKKRDKTAQSAVDKDLNATDLLMVCLEWQYTAGLLKSIYSKKGA